MTTIHFTSEDQRSKKRKADKAWAEKHARTHKRINFYIPRTLADQLTEKAKNSEYRTVSAFLLNAVNTWLAQSK